MPHFHALAVAAWALVPLFAWADRTVGGAGRRSLAFGVILLVGVLIWALSHSLAPAAVALAWIIYRSLPWKVGGGTTPRSVAEVVAALVRHLMPAAAGGALMLASMAPGHLPILLLGYGLAATGLAVAYARHVDSLAAQGRAETGRANALVETLRGAMFGAVLAVSADLLLTA